MWGNVYTEHIFEIYKPNKATNNSHYILFPYLLFIPVFV